MATASVVPSGGTLLLEREAQVAALEALAGAPGRRWAIRRYRGKCRHRQDAPARRGARHRWLGGMRVLAARGGELLGEFAYGIVRQLFEPLLASANLDLHVKSSGACRAR